LNQIAPAFIESKIVITDSAARWCDQLNQKSSERAQPQPYSDTDGIKRKEKGQTKG
jgi:hypothetical protein